MARRPAGFWKIDDPAAAAGATSADLQDFAALLAGLPARDHNAAPHAMRETQAWSNHAAKFDALFGSFDAKFARPFSTWADVTLQDAPSAETIFYPMSGPDITFPSLLYPQAETYVLCGLEPCGGLPDLARIAAAPPEDLFSRLETALRHFLDHSYFVTADMRVALNDVQVPGVVPILLILLARMGCVIKSVDTFDLGQETNTSSIVLDGVASAVCISFERFGPRRLIYVQQDLRDGFFSEQSLLHRFVAELERPAALIKSASYLLHEANFSTVRRLIMEKCTTIVQDPSSLPYGFLLQHGRDVELHGNYAGTLPVFVKYEQDDLIDAYRQRSRKALNFGFSYLKRPEIASLMVAKGNGRERLSQDRQA